MMTLRGSEPSGSGSGRRSQIQAIDRSVALLDAVARAGPGGAQLRALATIVGLNPSTARTNLAALAIHGLVTQRDSSRRYRLGPLLFALNQTYVAQTDLAAVAAPILRELWEQTAETVHLAVLDGAKRVDISVLVGPQLLNVNPGAARAAEGATVPLEQTAAGKVLLACLDSTELAAVRRPDWEYFASHPRPLASVLAAELESVRSLGYATNIDEGAIGVCGVAASVFDHTGRTIAALCVGYPAARHSDGYFAAMLAAVRESAHELSATMGAPAVADEVS